MTPPKDTLIRRSMRRFVLGSGPLKRRSDRLQTVARFAVVLSFLVAPMLAVAVATSTTTHLQSVAEDEAAERSPVDAVLLEDAPALAGSDNSYNPATRVRAPAVWSVPGGMPQEGSVLTQPGTRVGTVVPVWVDREGNITRPPLDRAGISASAAAVGALPLIGVPAVTWTLYAFLCIALDNHRERRWAEDWAAVEPKWNSRLL